MSDITLRFARNCILLIAAFVLFGLSGIECAMHGHVIIGSVLVGIEVLSCALVAALG